MKYLRGALILLFGIFSVASASAEDQKLAKALNNVSYQLAQCGAYFTIMAACLQISNTDQKTIDGYNDLSTKALERGFELGKLVHLTMDANESRFKSSYDEQMKLLNGSCVNISSLQTRYEARCERLMLKLREVVEEEKAKQ